MHVCNPVTRRSALVPTPCIWPFFHCRVYLMFDPTVTLHYSVLYFPDVPAKSSALPPLQHGRKRSRPSSCAAQLQHEIDRMGSMEWPPYSYPVFMFSSSTGQWEQKHFIRVGDPTVTVSDVWSDPSPPTSTDTIRRYAVYWKQALYLHCRGGFIIRYGPWSQQVCNYCVVPRVFCLITVC
jgi:hypothetical protein